MMKQLHYFLLAFALLALYSCSDDNDDQNPTVDPPMADERISFESSENMLDAAEMPMSLPGVEIEGGWVGGKFTNMLCGKDYMMSEDQLNGDFFNGLLVTTADKKIGFGSFFTNNRLNVGYGDGWGGFVITRNYCQTPNGGVSDYKKQHFSAWTSMGAAGSATCAVAYENSFLGISYENAVPRIAFSSPRTPRSIYLANATMTGQYESKLKDYWFKVTITGFLGEQKGKSVEAFLIKDAVLVKDWMQVDLTTLGSVDCLKFTVTSNDMSGIYLNCPTYFCIDELALVKLPK